MLLNTSHGLQLPERIGRNCVKCLRALILGIPSKHDANGSAAEGTG